MDSQSSKQRYTGQDKRQYLRCPYVRKHKVEPRKLMNHILKCKKSLSKKYLQRFTTCKYNSMHIFTIYQIGAHQMSCPNRCKIEKLEQQLLQEPKVLMEEISQFSSHPSIAVPIKEAIPTKDDINYISVHSRKSSKSVKRSQGKKQQNGQQRVVNRVSDVMNDIYNNAIGVREEQNDFDKYFNINYYSQNWFDQVQNQLINMKKVNQSINTYSLNSENSKIQQRSQPPKQQQNDIQQYSDQNNLNSEQRACYNLTLSSQSQQQNLQQQEQEIIVHQQSDSSLQQLYQPSISFTQVTQCTSEKSYHERSITSNKTLIHMSTKKGMLFTNNKKQLSYSNQKQLNQQHQKIRHIQQPHQEKRDKVIIQKKMNQKFSLSLFQNEYQQHKIGQQALISNQQNVQGINDILIVDLKVSKKKEVEMSCRNDKKNARKQQTLSIQDEGNQEKQLAQCQICKNLLCDNKIRLWRHKKIIKLLKAYSKLQEQHQLIKQKLKIQRETLRSIQIEKSHQLKKSQQILIVSDNSSNSKSSNSKAIQKTIINQTIQIQRSKNNNQSKTTKEISLGNFTYEQNKTRANFIIQI